MKVEVLLLQKRGLQHQAALTTHEDNMAHDGTESIINDQPQSLSKNQFKHMFESKCGWTGSFRPGFKPIKAPK